MANEKRLIDAKEIERQIKESFKNANPYLMGQMLRWIRLQTKVDAVEVVHAKWLDIQFDSIWRSMLATCSHCKVRGKVRVKSNECGFAVPDSDYCPQCGAKMDGETKD